MDRIYTADDYIIIKFHEYAHKNGWSYKTENNFSNKEMITFNKNHYRAKMIVKIIPGEYNFYPYMDTFARLNIKEGKLYNDYNSDEIGHILTGIYGNFISKNYPSLIKRFANFFTERI